MEVVGKGDRKRVSRWNEWITIWSNKQTNKETKKSNIWNSNRNSSNNIHNCEEFRRKYNRNNLKEKSYYNYNNMSRSRYNNKLIGFYCVFYFCDIFHYYSFYFFVYEYVERFYILATNSTSKYI